ncbi:MAG: hypothetical protein CW716_09035 [Candidatus Bathyarchaeum sp.]|nr:MAG: hypothetical protein CW716_09035 [Candidatus Bathyarchaeum sp.]
MPVTPLHHPVAYFIYKLYNRLSLPGLIVGCMFPDIENPFIMLLYGTQVPNRMVLHSILGSATIGTFFAVIVTVWVYPALVSRLFHVNKKKLESKCKLSFAVVFSVLIGILSHVLLDITNHPYNPLFWPFIPTTSTPSPIYFALGSPLGSLWMQVIMAAVLAVLIFVKRKNLFEELLVG